MDQSELVAELLKELSNHNERVEERKGALCELLRLIRENTLQVWDEHFKTILLLLLETLGDREVPGRSLTHTHTHCFTLSQSNTYHANAHTLLHSLTFPLISCSHNPAALLTRSCVCVCVCVCV